VVKRGQQDHIRVAGRHDPRSTLKCESDGSAGERHHPVVESRNRGFLPSPAVSRYRQGVESAKIVSAVVPGVQIEEELTPNRKFVGLLVCSECGGYAGSEVRRSQKHGLANAWAGRRNEGGRAGVLLACQIAAYNQPPML